MRNTRTKVVMGLVLFGGWTIVACSAGVGSPPDIGQAYGDKPFGAADKPGVTGQDPQPGAGGTGGGSTGVSSGGSSSGTSGSSGGGAGCPPCDGTITCQVTPTGQASQTAPLPLKTKNGACVLESSGGDLVFACDGTITVNGQPGGTWQNCVKGSTPTPTTTATTTPVPTTTGTPVDAGTKG